jgi:succinate dehydrogenase / fumarate reductase membrane anchor subunit
MSYQVKGLQAWLFQRLSAAFMLVYIIYFVTVLIFSAPMSYQQWSAWFSEPLMNTVTGLFFINFVVHAWVGMRDVVLDYISNDSLRLITLAGISFFLLISCLWMLRILFSLALIIN